MDHLSNRARWFGNLLVLPFIWFPFFAVVILDLCMEIYHRIGFRLTGLKLVKRSHYIRIDRHKLSYLNFLQKIYCLYCGYVNGVINYWVEIAGRTEKYWCGIMHESINSFVHPKHHTTKNFAKYGDEEDFKKKYK